MAKQLLPTKTPATIDSHAQLLGDDLTVTIEGKTVADSKRKPRQPILVGSRRWLELRCGTYRPLEGGVVFVRGTVVVDAARRLRPCGRAVPGDRAQAIERNLFRHHDSRDQRGAGLHAAASAPTSFCDQRRRSTDADSPQ